MSGLQTYFRPHRHTRCDGHDANLALTECSDPVFREEASVFIEDRRRKHTGIHPGQDRVCSASVTSVTAQPITDQRSRRVGSIFSTLNQSQTSLAGGLGSMCKMTWIRQHTSTHYIDLCYIIISLDFMRAFFHFLQLSFVINKMATLCQLLPILSKISVRNINTSI